MGPAANRITITQPETGGPLRRRRPLQLPRLTAPRGYLRTSSPPEDLAPAFKDTQAERQARVKQGDKGSKRPRPRERRDRPKPHLSGPRRRPAGSSNFFRVLPLDMKAFNEEYAKEGTTISWPSEGSAPARRFIKCDTHC